MVPRLVIAGAQSGVGKTTITVGLIGALRKRGLIVQPFKVGPDYIDPTYHTLASGRPCRNLDTWLMAPDRMRQLFEQATRDVDIAVIEGVMGVFDGVGYRDETGSTAEVAKQLDAPVVLVMDVAKMARSAAAMALGFRQLDPRLRLAGFIVNRGGSDDHCRGVAAAIQQATALPVFGTLMRSAPLSIPERHLGLVPTCEPGKWTAFIAAATEIVETQLNLELMLDDCARRPGFNPGGAAVNSLGHKPQENDAPYLNVALEGRQSTSECPIIAVAHDEAFHFTYRENLELLAAAGADIQYFSPLHDSSLPAGSAGITLSGGFPEVFARDLSGNHAMCQAIRTAASQEIPIYAECGGLMYLTEALVDLENHTHAMVGLLPGQAVMSGKLTLGYRMARAAADSWLLREGEAIRGHEFHYSHWEGRPSILRPAYHVCSPRDEGRTWPEGARCANLFASYLHLHFWSKPELAERFVAACRHSPMEMIAH